MDLRSRVVCRRRGPVAVLVPDEKIILPHRHMIQLHPCHLRRQSSKGAHRLAVGVGLGVFLWFLVLIELVTRLKNHPAGEWIKNSTTLAGVLLVGFGLAFTWKSFRAL